MRARVYVQLVRGRVRERFSVFQAESAPQHPPPTHTASAAPADDATPFLAPAPVSPGPARLTARSLTGPFVAAVPTQRGVPPPASAAKPAPPASAAKPAPPASAAKPALPASAAKPAPPSSAAKPAPAAPTHAAPATPPQAATPTMPPAPAAPPSPAAVQLPPIMLAPAPTLSPLLAPSLPTGVAVGGGDAAQLPASTLLVGAAAASPPLPAAQLLPPIVPRLPPHTVSLRILVAGPPGAGKSSLVAALAAGGVDLPCDVCDSRGGSGGRCAHTRRSFAAGGGTLVATFVEADVVTKEDAQAVADCVRHARAAALDAERAPRRSAAAAGDNASRCDAALLLLPPHAPVTAAACTLVGALVDAGVKVILPVLTASDAYTKQELSCARAAARAALPDLPPLPFSDAVLDAAASPRAAPPFASVCGDRAGCGLAGVGPPSDVASLRALLLGPGVADIKAATDASYEAWRSDALRGGWDRGSRARRARAALAREPWRTLAAFAAAAVAGYAAIAFAVGGRARLADDAASLRRAVVGRARRAERVAAAGAAAAASQAARAAGGVEAAAAAAREKAADVAGSAAGVAHPQVEKPAPRFWLW